MNFKNPYSINFSSYEIHKCGYQIRQSSNCKMGDTSVDI